MPIKNKAMNLPFKNKSIRKPIPKDFFSERVKNQTVPSDFDISEVKPIPDSIPSDLPKLSPIKLNQKLAKKPQKIQSMALKPTRM